MTVDISSGSVVGGEYVVERLIGKGGMGAVYLARQRSTNRLRALKVLDENVVSDPRAADRFAREAMVGSLIESQHVVEVIAAGIDQGPQGRVPWLVMEYLEGEELTDHVARQPDQCLHPAHARLVLEQVFHALAAAHRAGIVHRDIKPENIYLAVTHMVGVPFVVKVLDFGIAKVASEHRSGSQTKSMGTPGWLAPEQLEASKCTPASDVWALGLLAFFVLTGRRFWLRENDENATLQGLLYEMVMSPIPPATGRAAEFSRAQLLPPGFDQWFAGCVERDPTRRYQDAAQAWPALSYLLGAAGGVQQPAPQPYGPSSVMTSQQADSSGVMSRRSSGTVASGPAQSQHFTPSNPQYAGAPPPISARSGCGTPAAPGTQIPGVGTSGALDGAWLQGRTDSQNGVGSGAFGPPQRAPKRTGPAGTIALVCGGLLGLGMLAAGVFAIVHKPGSADSGVPPILPVSASANAPIGFAAGSATAANNLADQDMVTLAGGTVVAGGTSTPVPAFQLDRTEVTVKQWADCIADHGCSDDVASVNVAGAQSWSVLCNWARRAELGLHPINCVSWADAVSFCQWAGKRLPTDQEWQYAAFVAGGARTYPWGNGVPPQGTVNMCGAECASMLGASHLAANYKPLGGYTDQYASTSPVSAMTNDKTPLGILGLGGNVMEWTATPHSGVHIRCRGANWLSTKLTDAVDTAVFAVDAKERRTNLGFRCAK